MPGSPENRHFFGAIIFLSFVFANNFIPPLPSYHYEIVVYEKKVAEYSNDIRDPYMYKIKGLISNDDYSDMTKYFMTYYERTSPSSPMEKQLVEIDEKIAADDN